MLITILSITIVLLLIKIYKEDLKNSLDKYIDQLDMYIDEHESQHISPNATNKHPILYVKKLHPDALLPKKATIYSAGYDTYAYIPYEQCITIPSGENKLIPTGLCMRPSEDYCIKLFPRSGLAYKKNVTLSNSVGLGDADYFHEYGVLLSNHSEEDVIIEHGDRICQIKVEKVETIEIKEVQELPPLVSNRTGGFGSTGD